MVEPREPASLRRRARCLIALDSAGAACSVAVWRDGAILARRFEAMARGQSERLVPMIEAAMAEAGVPYEALEAVAVTLGPGGFTGVRIGLAAARGLALARRIPLIGIDNFEAVAAGVPAAQRVGRILAVLLEAKRAEVYVRAFGPDGAALGPPAALLPNRLDGFLAPGPLLLVGDAVERARPALAAAGRDLQTADAPGLADAARVAELAAARPLPEPGTPAPRPLYLRGPDVTVPGVEPGR